MYGRLTIHQFYNLTMYVVIFLLIGLSHGIEVHTDDEVVAEYGESTTLHCSYIPTSTSDDFIRLIWTKGVQKILGFSDTDSHASTTSGRYNLVVDYVSSGNLTINDIQLDDEGSYTCDVKISGGLAKTSVVNLQVVAEPNELILRRRTAIIPVTIHQTAVILKPGEDVEFECEAIRSRPNVTIEWYIDEAPSNTDTGTSTPNSNDARLQDTTSSFVIANPDRWYHGKSLTCQAMIEGRIVRNTSIIIYVEEPPEQPITIHGLNDQISHSIEQTALCIAGGSFPASHITWYLDDVNVTGDAVKTTTKTTSDMMRVESKLDFMPHREDDGKILRCRIGHVTLTEDIVAEKAICLRDSEITMIVEQEHLTFLHLKLSGISHSALCTLRTCNTDKALSMTNLQDEGCTQLDLSNTYSDVIEHEYYIRDLMSSTTYEISVNCHHRSCGGSKASVEATTTGANPDPQPPQTYENVWIRDLIFVIIAVIVVSAFVIVVTVSIVLRAVVKGSMPVTGVHEENHVTTSLDRVGGASSRSSILSSMSTNLYTIEEGNEGEPNKIYHEIKELRSSLVRPSDIIVSPTNSSTQQRSNMAQSTRLIMRHPRPPPLPPPTHRVLVDTAVMTASVTASDSSDAESEKDDYVPMSPDAYSIGSDPFSSYMTMSSVNTN